MKVKGTIFSEVSWNSKLEDISEITSSNIIIFSVSVTAWQIHYVPTVCYKHWEK